MTAWNIAAAAVCLTACAFVYGEGPVGVPIEAEDFKPVKGWRADDMTCFPSQPNLWSRTKLVADETDEPALAVKEISIPHAGRYNVWVHYESCYGFGSVFSISAKQGNRTTEVGTFGRMEDIKSFPFGRGWAAQGPWYWHNTDYVYEFRTVDLSEGKAEISLAKGVNQRPAARRVVDFIYITDDLALRCGDDWAWHGKSAPPILSRFTRPYFVKVEYLKGEGAVSPTIEPRLWLLGYYKGPMDRLCVAKDGLSEKAPPADKRLQPGDATAWMRIDFSTVMPTVFTLKKDNADAALRISLSYEPDGKGTSRTFDWTAPEFQVVCAVGKPSYEKDIFPPGKSIIAFDELVAEKTKVIRAYEAPGHRAKRFFIQTSGISKELLDLAVATGVNSLYYTAPAFIYGPDAPDVGFNRTRVFLSVQNAHLTRECFEGDFSKLEASYRKLFDTQKEGGMESIPVEFKLIEEAGPPGLATLREWPAMREQFVAFLKERAVKPTEVLDRQTLAEVLARADRPSEEELWKLVQLGTGDYAESLSNPPLFYHSHVFRAELMGKTCARATELLEKVFGPKTLVSSGSFYPSTGSFPVLDRGDDPFTLFARRGCTSFSSEMSWGWGGTPDFIGPQVASYEGAVARALGKYHKCPRGTYVIADQNRGYTGDFIETYCYGLVSNCFYRLEFYFQGWPGECSAIASSDIHKGMKRVSYTVGAVEDKVLDSDVVPASVAIGWSLTTDVWDQATPPRERREVLTNTYPQERCLLHLLLRHCQAPVDVLAEQDLTGGHLKNYKVYFLVGDHLRPESAEALREWVRAGGTLIAVAGGGLRDHCDRPLPTLKEVFGIEEARLEKHDQCLRPKLELLHTPPVDRISFTAAGLENVTMDVYAYRQRIKAVKETTVLGTFADGSAAVTLNKFGTGKAILIGALPGLPYVRPGIPMLPYGRGGTGNLSTFVPTEFDAGVRAFMKHLLDEAGVRGPVTCSDPLVEPTLLASKDGTAYHVVLVNYGKEPKKELTVRVSGLGNLAPEDAPGVTFGTDAGDGALTARMSVDKFRLFTLKKK